LGWDCDTERLHAHRAQSPTSEQIMGVQAAVWLAYEALPCFPNGMAGNRMQSTGFSRHQRQNWLTWPLWDRPIPLGTAQTLLAVAELHRERPRFAELQARGGGRLSLVAATRGHQGVRHPQARHPRRLSANPKRRRFYRKVRT